MKNRDQAIYNIETKQKRVALTFDIGWGSKVPGPVLGILRKKKVAQATFFLSAPWAARHPRLAHTIRSRGYEIGSHGDLHVNYTGHGNRWIHRQVKKAEGVIRKVTGVKPVLFRPPNGDLNARVVRKLRRLGYLTVHWSVDSLDWKKPGVNAIVRRVLNAVGPGDIVLMHASDSASQTAKALPKIIDRLRARGYRLLTVSNLLAGRPRVHSAARSRPGRAVESRVSSTRAKYTAHDARRRAERQHAPRCGVCARSPRAAGHISGSGFASSSRKK
ncbi:polysaccharide deacetylase family protein [Paenibacillus elgii]|uniref:polysaccharide deacetylase family protein n=1 Tax=Paenibacillus elgii TaxID=189691 RepID=UPI0030D85B17